MSSYTNSSNSGAIAMLRRVLYTLYTRYVNFMRRSIDHWFTGIGSAQIKLQTYASAKVKILFVYIIAIYVGTFKYIG